MFFNIFQIDLEERRFINLECPVTRAGLRQLIYSIQIYFWQKKHSGQGGLEILYDCADGIDRDGDLDLADGELDAYRDKKSAKELNQLEVAIGEGMEFTIYGNFTIFLHTKLVSLYFILVSF